MRKYLSKQILIIIGLSISGCVGNNHSSGQPQSANPGIENHSGKLVRVDYGITHIIDNHITNGSIKPQIKSMTSSSESDQILDVVGWNSVTHSLAPQSCWHYNITLSDKKSAGSSNLVQNSSDLQHEFDMTSSITAKVDSLDELSVSGSYDDLYSSETDGASLVTTSAATGIATINVDGLSTIGEQILKNTPANFYSSCGDEVLLKIPVEVQISYLMHYKFESSAQNSDISAGLKLKSTYVDAAIEVNNQAMSSASTTSVDTSIFIRGNAEEHYLTSATKNLAYCSAVQDKTSSQISGQAQLSGVEDNITTTPLSTLCNFGLSSMDQAANVGYEDAEHEIMKDQGMVSSWQSLLAINYSNISSSNTMSSRDKLLEIFGESAISNVSTLNAIEPYTPNIIHNINVLQDLLAANAKLNKIAKGINMLPSGFASSVTRYPTNSDLANRYSNALKRPIETLEADVDSCLTANTVNDIDTYCKNLDIHSSVTSELEKHINPSFNDALYQKEALEYTVKALIYNDQVTFNPLLAHQNAIQSLNSFIVYLPAKQLEEGHSRSKFVLLTVPVNPGQQKATIGGKSVEIYMGAFQVAADNENQNFWGDWDKFSELRSGGVGYYNYDAGVLPPQPLANRAGKTEEPIIFDKIESAAINQNSSCSPFGADSSSCIYTVTTKMDPAIIYDNKGVFPEMTTITQTIKTNYNYNLTCSGSNIFGTNQFATLYPFINQPNCESSKNQDNTAN